MRVHPILDSNEVNEKAFKDYFVQFGSVVVRKLLDKDILNSLLQRAEAAYSAYDQQHDLGQRVSNHQNNVLEKFGAIAATELDEPGGPANSMIKMFLDSRIPSLYANLLGRKFTILSGISVPRRQGPFGRNPSVPYHQDATFTGNQGLIINSWIPLNQVGIKAPGLEVILSPQSEVLSPPGYMGRSAASYDEIDLKENFIIQKFHKNMFWSPVLEPGDVMFFSHLTIHRTYITPQMKKSRISLEIRCT